VSSCNNIRIPITMFWSRIDLHSTPYPFVSTYNLQIYRFPCSLVCHPRVMCNVFITSCLHAHASTPTPPHLRLHTLATKAACPLSPNPSTPLPRRRRAPYPPTHHLIFFRRDALIRLLAHLPMRPHSYMCPGLPRKVWHISATCIRGSAPPHWLACEMSCSSPRKIFSAKRTYGSVCSKQCACGQSGMAWSCSALTFGLSFNAHLPDPHPPRPILFLLSLW